MGQEIVNVLFDLEMLSKATDEYTRFTIYVALILVPFFYGMEFVWNFLKSSWGSLGAQPKLFDKNELARGLIIWFLIAAYVPVFGNIEKLAHTITRMSTPEEFVSWKQDHAKIVTPIPGETTETSESMDSPEFNSVLGFDIVTALKSAMSAMVTGSIAILGYITGIVISGISVVIGKVFYVIGPLTLAFSVLGIFRDKFSRWFGVWLLLLLNPLTVNALNGILIQLTSDSFSNLAAASTTLHSGIGIIIFNVIIIICYILTFWMTSFIVGSPDGGKVLSTAAGMATMAAMSGAKIFGSKSGAAGVVDDVVTGK